MVYKRYPAVRRSDNNDIFEYLKCISFAAQEILENRLRIDQGNNIHQAILVPDGLRC
jgi:hypothetical protein